jgi:hypothetical protein
MDNNIEKKILTFANELGGITRTDMVHGTLYIKLERDSDCDYIHREIRNYYKEFINPEGGVNMYAVGDEFAYDFVPEDREAPVFAREDEDQDEEEEIKLTEQEEAEIDTLLDLQNDAKEGR